MLSRLVNVGKWMRALRQFESGDYNAFLATIRRFPDSMKFSHMERAMIATSNLIVGQIDDAQNQFADLATQTSSSDDPNDQYLRQYALARLDGMSGNTDKVYLRAEETKGLKCKELYRERLPIM